jgi:hypothetical protein
MPIKIKGIKMSEGRLIKKSVSVLSRGVVGKSLYSILKEKLLSPQK